MAKIQVAFDRAHAGTAFDIADKLVTAKLDGVPLGDAVANEIVERAVERYQVHIRAALARAGLNIAEGETLTADVLLRAINDKTGLGLTSWNPESIRDAVQSQVSSRLSGVLGFDVGGINSGEALKEALIESAKQAVISGRATSLLSSAAIKKLRKLKTYKGEGVEEELMRKKLMSRVYQKTFRRTHKEVWVDSPSDTGFTDDMYGHRRDT